MLLKSGGLVKTIKFSNPKYVGDPINAVKIFNEKEVDELLILDIDATKKNKSPNFDLLNRIGKEAFMPMTYGGGIKNVDDVNKILSSGFEKICLNSSVLKTKAAIIKQIVDIYGSQSVVVSIDVKKNIFGKYKIYDYLNKKTTNLDPIDYAKYVENLGAGEIFLNSVDREGTMLGYDIELIKYISREVRLPVIASGGAGKLEDFEKAVKIGGASAVAAGSFFVFQGIHRAVLITYPDRKDLEKILI